MMPAALMSSRINPWSVVPAVVTFSDFTLVKFDRTHPISETLTWPLSGLQ